MTEENASEAAVEFSCNSKTTDLKPSPRKTKIVVISALTAVLLLGAVASVSVYFVMRKPASTHLAEIKLEEGESLTYRVDQNIEIKAGNAQKGTIRSIIGIRVLNKTSEEYWFLMKFNLSYVNGDMDIRGMKVTTEYFLVRLQIASRSPDFASDTPGESFEVYGKRDTDAELLRQVYFILEQLLPTLKRDLYEDVDGKKLSGTKSQNVEDSPLLPGFVKMHRKANTSDKEALIIKNHFDRADFRNLSSEIDLDLKYSDYAFVNKSNGMVTESHAYFTEQLNFGEPMHNKGDFDVSMLEITLSSHISLIENSYFGYAESKGVSLHYFVKLVVPKSQAAFSVNKNPHRPPASTSTPTETPTNGSVFNQHHNSTNSSAIPLKRSRRDADVVPWEEASPLDLDVEHSFTLFEENVIGINVKGEGKVWLEGGGSTEIGVSLRLVIGGISQDILYEQYQREQLEDGLDIQTGNEWRGKIGVSIPVFFLTVGVDFSLTFKVNIQLKFPAQKNSLSPVKLAIEIEPFAEATASIEGHISAYLIRVAVYGDGTLIRVDLPVTLSYHAARSAGRKWCVDLSSSLTALELSARIYYQWRNWWSWGTRHTLIEFGTWDGINYNRKLLERCG